MYFCNIQSNSICLMFYIGSDVPPILSFLLSLSPSHSIYLHIGALQCFPPKLGVDWAKCIGDIYKYRSLCSVWRHDPILYTVFVLAVAEHCQGIYMWTPPVRPHVPAMFVFSIVHVLFLYSSVFCNSLSTLCKYTANTFETSKLRKIRSSCREWYI